MAKEFFTLRGHRYPITTGKKGEAISAAAKYNKGFCLHDVYTSYSGSKAAAWDACYAECKAVNGHNFRITGSNTSIFTVAYEVTDEATGAVITVVNTGRSRYYVYY